MVTQKGFAQCPTRVRLPPGLDFSDGGLLAGEVAYDPHRPERYAVEFVAVSTADWRDDAIGLVRLEVTFVVKGNTPPTTFDSVAFRHAQQEARAECRRLQENLYEIWYRWERQILGNRETCDQMFAELKRLRAVLERHPRLDDGQWWAQLGGFHMNVHKLLENALFECELYLGYALTFGNRDVRQMAEQNLKGCYQKRQLEAARFMWIDGVQQIMNGQWRASIETFQRAAAKKDGWGWAVNYGDIWLGEAVARIVCGIEDGADDSTWLKEAQNRIGKASQRANESGAFGVYGHPWIIELNNALSQYQKRKVNTDALDRWLDDFKSRTIYWCGQILSGAAPFPPKPKPRIDDAKQLINDLLRL